MINAVGGQKSRGADPVWAEPIRDLSAHVEVRDKERHCLESVMFEDNVRSIPGRLDSVSFLSEPFFRHSTQIFCVSKWTSFGLGPPPL